MERASPPSGYSGTPLPVKLGIRPGQVFGEYGQVPEGAGGIGPLDAFGMLIQGDPPITRGLGQHRHHPLPVSVRGAQVTRALPGIHTPDDSRLDARTARSLP